MTVVMGLQPSCPAKAWHPVRRGLEIILPRHRLLDHPLLRMMTSLG
jgi:hypothetical protein